MKFNFIRDGFLNQLSKSRTSDKEEKYPKISIVMPSYNQVKYIERSILSVLNQNYPNFELIIIDGGSNDGTVDIIKKYNDKIHFWSSEKDKGQSDALNKGFKNCSGEFYGWLNSDDIYLPDTFEILGHLFKKKLYKKIIYGDWLFINNKDEVIEYYHAFDFNLNHFKYEGFHLNAQSMFWHKSVHERFTGFQIDLHNTMDYQMILEFGINEGQKTFMRIPKTLGAFRRYEGQKTSKMTNQIQNEHKLISERYQYTDKYKLTGKLKRLYFRFRRAFWYYKRGGIYNLIVKFKNAYIADS